MEMLLAVTQRMFDEDVLALHNGASTTAYLSILGTVYDVTPAKHKYGEF